MKKEYIIQGRYKDNKWYLYTLAGDSPERAKIVLDEVLINPSLYSPKHALYSDFRILEVEASDCWWNNWSLD